MMECMNTFDAKVIPVNRPDVSLHRVCNHKPETKTVLVIFANNIDEVFEISCLGISVGNVGNCVLAWPQWILC